MSIRMAKRHFAGNLKLLAPAFTRVEKDNLYNGLHSLAEAIGGIEETLTRIESRLERIERIERAQVDGNSA